MKIHHYTEVEAKEEFPGVDLRWVLGAAEGAPNFAMRVFEVRPGCATPYHQHPHEHEVFIIAGKGAARSRDGETPLEPGHAIYVAPNDEHCFANKGNEVLRLICVIPLPKT